MFLTQSASVAGGTSHEGEPSPESRPSICLVSRGSGARSRAGPTSPFGRGFYSAHGEEHRRDGRVRLGIVVVVDQRRRAHRFDSITHLKIETEAGSSGHRPQIEDHAIRLYFVA